MEIKLSYLPARPEKQRTTGLTIIQDDGLSLNNIKDLIATSGHLVDSVRFSPSALCSDE